mmetsp:Transcript_129549/g.360944  ORF Transcript_129549/g.360944 Transcript_129549/m.360944 type:complete len:339 (-) Transcript_129549:137-1153(-)
MEASGASAPELTKARATSLLNELSAGLRLKTLPKKRLAQDRSEEKPEEPVQDLALWVQREILPRYGFEARADGLCQLWQALCPLVAAEPALAALAAAARLKLQEVVPWPSASGDTSDRKSNTEPAKGTETRGVWVVPRFCAAPTSTPWTLHLDVSEGTSVSDMRKSLQVHFGVPPSRLRLLEQDSGTVKELEGSDDAARATVLYIPSVAPSFRMDGPLLTRAMVLAILRECLARFQEPAFQRRLQALVGRHRNRLPAYGNSPGQPLLWVLPGRFELVRPVYNRVMAKYGVTDGPRGLGLLEAAAAQYLNDLEVIKLAMEMNDSLAFPPQLFDLRPRTV